MRAYIMFYIGCETTFRTVTLREILIAANITFCFYFMMNPMRYTAHQGIHRTFVFPYSYTFFSDLSVLHSSITLSYKDSFFLSSLLYHSHQKRNGFPLLTHHHLQSRQAIRPSLHNRNIMPRGFPPVYHRMETQRESCHGYSLRHQDSCNAQQLPCGH